MDEERPFHIRDSSADSEEVLHNSTSSVGHAIHIHPSAADDAVAGAVLDVVDDAVDAAYAVDEVEAAFAGVAGVAGEFVGVVDAVGAADAADSQTS